MLNILKRLVKDEEGQGLVEYVLIIAVISLIIIVAGKPLATAIKEKFEEVGDELTT